MKKITLYQATTEEVFIRNMMRQYASIDELEAVVMLRVEDEPDDDILDSLFSKFNDEEYKYSLAYSMSVGDIITIDNTSYRCMPIGWETI